MTAETVQKLEYIISGSKLTEQERDEIIDLMESYAESLARERAVEFDLWRFGNEYYTRVQNGTQGNKELKLEELYDAFLADRNKPSPLTNQFTIKEKKK